MRLVLLLLLIAARLPSGGEIKVKIKKRIGKGCPHVLPICGSEAGRSEVRG